MTKDEAESLLKKAVPKSFTGKSECRLSEAEPIVVIHRDDSPCHKANPRLNLCVTVALTDGNQSYNGKVGVSGAMLIEPGTKLRDRSPVYRSVFGTGNTEPEIPVFRSTDFRCKSLEYSPYSYLSHPCKRLVNVYQPPVPVSARNGRRNSVAYPPSCPQVTKEKQLKGIKEIMGEEDCLYLNVFTPSTQEKNYPVMVYIHGGAFLTGSASRHNPELFLDQDIVIVTIQYRLGILGFLSTEDEELPGNLGLMDQTLALRWVHRNIARFGGDNTKITICGLSAGAASAHMHLFNPHAKGLFSRAILMSGSALCPWALRRGHREVAMKIGQTFNCNIDPQDGRGDRRSKLLAECLRRAPLPKLVSSFMDFQAWNSLPWETVPRVDGDYLPDHPALLLSQGRFHDVSIITGVNLHEGRIVTQGMFSDPEMFQALANNFDAVAARAALLFQDGDYRPQSLARYVFDAYLGGGDISPKSLADEEALTQLFGDRFFKIPHDDTWNSTWHHRGAGRVFTYELMHNKGKKWVVHPAILQYLFPYRNAQQLEGVDKQLSDTLVKLWVNFARSGDPTPDSSLGFRWSSVSESKRAHLRLTPTPIMTPHSRLDEWLLWTSLPTEANRFLHLERIQEYLQLHGNNDE
ncbi:venom carboxylesterase-6-like [Penaeus japonicus]|uniref:venom carboxylesterase-6-like n=1 Tax=Penaeus japonicus TaxID=27405 RepID=UPI001C70E834|nr:venom carboxylesterase-6-like [Penaeus japonicus]